MGEFPVKCLVDTNVPVTANKAKNIELIPDELVRCVFSCIEAIEHVVKNSGLVIDSGDEIFSEYRKNLKLRGQPGVGDKFMKWVHDKRWSFPKEDRVTITKVGKSYKEFPAHAGLADFDNSDRKFVAVANAHPEKPPILQATDSHWLKWIDALQEVDIKVLLLCPVHIKKTYQQRLKRKKRGAPS